MIEINLLPEEMRQPEGTPPARLAIILLGVVVGCFFSFLVAKYWLVEIPNMQTEINNRNTEIEDLKKRKETVEKVIAQIEVLNQKVNALDKLIDSRVRFARILDRLADSVPTEGAWFRSFNVAPDAAPSTGVPGAGKRYVINLTGYTTGNTELDRAQQLTDLMNRLEQQFRERDVDAKSGVNKFLSARFDRPTLLARTLSPVPAPAITDPKILKALNVPKEGLDFTLTMSFEMRSSSDVPQ